MALRGCSDGVGHDLRRQLELFLHRVNQLLHFSNVTADLIDHLSLSLHFRLGRFELASILTPQLLCLLLVMVGLLQLHLDAFELKLDFFTLSLLFLRLAVFALSCGLELAHFVVQVLNTPQHI